MKNNEKKARSAKEIGNWGEDLAEIYLIKNGYEVLTRNYYSQYGEIDIIGTKNDQIVFFEVKTRTNEAFGHPEEAIDQKKINCTISTALCYLDEKEEDRGWQMDLLAIKIFPDGTSEIIHFEGIND